MTAIVACLPDWYLNAWIREEDSIWGTVVAWTQALAKFLLIFVRTIFFPVNCGARLIEDKLSPTAVWEFFCGIACVLFAVWLTANKFKEARGFVGALEANWPWFAWVGSTFVIGIGHLIALRHGAITYRASLLALSTALWHMLLLIAVKNQGFTAASVPLLFTACLVGWICIRILHGGNRDKQ